MAISKITTKGILDGTIATADLVDNAVSSAKVGVDVLVAEDSKQMQLQQVKLQTVLTQAKLNASVSLGVGYYIGKDGTVSGNANGRDNLFRVNTNATTGNITINGNNNASVVED